MQTNTNCIFKFYLCAKYIYKYSETKEQDNCSYHLDTVYSYYHLVNDNSVH